MASAKRDDGTPGLRRVMTSTVIIISTVQPVIIAMVNVLTRTKKNKCTNIQCPIQ